MTDVRQVGHAVSLGVDAIGMILHANSPRVVSVEQAKLIRDVVPAFVTLVGVFVDADQDTIERNIEQIGLDVVQLHGNETELFGEALSRPYIKAIRAKSKNQVERECGLFPSANGILLDPYVKGQHGGTGLSLKTELWPETNESQSLILAGGLSVDNIASRIEQLSPYAVDLNSGLESSPGQKDLHLLTQAVEQVYLTDALIREHKNGS